MAGYVRRVKEEEEEEEEEVTSMEKQIGEKATLHQVGQRRQRGVGEVSKNRVSEQSSSSLVSARPSATNTTL